MKPARLLIGRNLRVEEWAIPDVAAATAANARMENFILRAKGLILESLKRVDCFDG